MIGISRDPKDFSVSLFQELTRRGYDVVPVNPNSSFLQGRPCFARVQDIQPPVDAALLMTGGGAGFFGTLLCAGGGGPPAVSFEAVRYCQERGIQVIPGQCPFMFLPGTGGVHRFHGFIRKLTGRYPRRVQRPAGSEA